MLEERYVGLLKRKINVKRRQMPAPIHGFDKLSYREYLSGGVFPAVNVFLFFLFPLFFLLFQ